MSIILASPEARATFDGYQEKAKKEQLEEMRNIIKASITAGRGKNKMEISQVASQDLCKKISAIPKDDIFAIMREVYGVVEKVFSCADIDDIEIPLIIFTGPEEELAVIFQKLNQEGVKLSKYDVFAATWVNKLVQIKDDPSFVGHIIKKYEIAQEKSDLEITDYDPDEMKQKGKLTVFEYAFGVGKALMDACNKLFPETDEEKVDSIGFLLLAELVGLSYQEMGRLAERITSYKNFNAKKFKDAILDAGRIVENSLEPYIETPAKTKSGKRKSLACHSDLQVASYIITVFKLKYDVTPEGELVPKAKSKELARVKDFLYKHYMYDILRSFWAGSGDTKLEALIADPTTCRYTRDVSKVDFEGVVAEWLSGQNEKKAAVNVSAEVKLFLNYLLRTSGTYNEKLNYDVEHCVPRDTLKKHYINKGITVPISSACNLVYIPAGDNRSKGDLTYYQRKNDAGTYSLNQDQLDAMGYPTEQDLEFVKATDTLTEKNYFGFLQDRRDIICHKIIEALYK